MTPFTTPHIPETEVVRLWQEQVNRQRQMQDSAGNPLEVVYPGRSNDGRGGDFRDAVVQTGDGRHSGCIEVHTVSNGWQVHGHHLDPAYNKVVLHVALEPPPSGHVETIRQNGETVPTVLLDRLMSSFPETESAYAGLPCRANIRDRSSLKILEYLELSGRQRLLARTSGCTNEIAAVGPGQALYCRVAEALGYSKNQEPFRKLAGSALLAAIEEIIHSDHVRAPEDRGLIRLQAYLLKQAGLLPSQRSLTCSDNYSIEIESIAAGIPVAGCLSPSNWELFKVRPVNYPVRRIIALSYLLWRFHRSGWLNARWYNGRWYNGLIDLTRHSPSRRPYLALESTLLVPAEGYWSGHYDFGKALRGSSPFLLGRERAADIIINAVLPFSLAWGRLNGEPDLVEKAEQIAAGYPCLESNSIERHMLEQLSLNRRDINSARRQQGLLHIYKTLCTQGRCNECGLAK